MIIKRKLMILLHICIVGLNVTVVYGLIVSQNVYNCRQAGMFVIVDKQLIHMAFCIYVLYDAYVNIQLQYKQWSWGS